MKNTFVKINKMFINVDQIGAVYPPRDYNGYVVLIHGKEFHVSSEEGREIIDRIIEHEEQKMSSSFDPVKRISSTTNKTTALTASKINKLRMIVNEFNKSHSYTQFTMSVLEDGSIKISRDDSLGAVITISTTGIIIDDTVSNSHNDFKTDIINALNE